MLFLPFSFPENFETAPKSVTVILVLTDVDGADGTELPALRLLYSGEAITLRMLFISFSFPEKFETAPKSVIVILVLTDVDGTDRTELPPLYQPS